MDRRQFLKLSAAAGAAFAVPGFVVRGDRSQVAQAARLYVPAAPGLSDPALQPKFEQLAPNALNPGFLFAPLKNGSKAGQFNLSVRQTRQQTGLRRNGTGPLLTTDVWGYGDGPPRGGNYPTWCWAKGEVVVDSHTLLVADEIPAGTYLIAVGLYDTGGRVVAFAEDGTRLANDAVILGTVEVRDSQ